MTARDSTRRTVLVVLAAGAAAFTLLNSVIVPVLPTIQHDLDTTQATTAWLLTGYLLAAAVATPILGRIGDMVGKERMLVVALAALAVGSALAAVAGTIEVMIAARVIQGVGGAVFPLSFGIARDALPQERVPGAVGAISATGAAMGGLGLVIAGPIDDLVGYRWLFWIPMVICVTAAITAHRVIPRSPRREPGRLGWAAPLLLSGWLVALLLGVSKAPQWGWGSSRVLGLLAASVVLGVTWVAVELRATTPLIDMRMMRLRTVWTANLAAVLFGVGMFVVFGFMPQFAETPASTGYGIGASVTGAGLLLLPMTLASAGAGVVVGPLTRRYGSRNLLIAGSSLSVLPFLFLIAWHDQAWQLLVAMIVAGFAFGTSFSALPNLIVAAVPPAQTGVASGMNANMRVIGGAIGTALMASIVTSSARADGFPAESGYVDGFAMLAVVMFLTVLAALLVPTVQRATTAPDEPAPYPGPERAMVAAAPLASDDVR